MTKIEQLKESLERKAKFYHSLAQRLSKDPSADTLNKKEHEAIRSCLFEEFEDSLSHLGYFFIKDGHFDIFEEIKRSLSILEY